MLSSRCKLRRQGRKFLKTWRRRVSVMHQVWRSLPSSRFPRRKDRRRIVLRNWRGEEKRPRFQCLRDFYAIIEARKALPCERGKQREREREREREGRRSRSARFVRLEKTRYPRDATSARRKKLCARWRAAGEMAYAALAFGKYEIRR